VVALRAAVHALRGELDAAWESAAAASVAARAAEAARWALAMPLVQAALAPSEVAETRAAAGTPSMTGVTTIALDLRPDTARTEIVLADLPESALLDPRKARDADIIDVTEPATAAAADPPLSPQLTTFGTRSVAPACPPTC
jgi:hypothetical protein